MNDLLGEKFFMVSNGKMVLHLYPAEEGGYCVTSPFDTSLITQAETIEEAFEMAEDAAALLAEYRTETRRKGSKLKGKKAPRRKTAAKKVARS